ncbi:MAG: hypothetical protein IAE94_11330 [Chthoniobacterales bacterium]|nr:hypothetical protein [Chthoniobacterales bacterium]
MKTPATHAKAPGAAPTTIFRARLLLPSLLSSIFLLAATLYGEAPVLDLTVTEGILEDKSSFQRQLQVSGVQPTDDDKNVLLPSLDAVQIAFAEGDPLFGAEAFTFMIRCKFGSLDPYPDRPFFFVGRWDILNDGRIIGLSFNQSGAGLTFAASQFGSVSEKSLFGAELPELPGETWVVVVGQYDPGQTLKVQLYNADGELLANNKSKQSPPRLHQAQTPFQVGCIPGAQMQIGRVLVWNRCLDDADVQDEVEKLTK